MLQTRRIEESKLSLHFVGVTNVGKATSHVGKANSHVGTSNTTELNFTHSNIVHSQYTDELDV